MKAFKDPIHRYIHADKSERKIMESPTFQRLRYINQNGIAYLIYPSAVGNRFVHSLGTMHVTSKIFDSVLRNSGSELKNKFLEKCRTNFTKLNQKFQKIDFPEVLCVLRYSALLHDVGVSPFSHALEDVMRKEIETHDTKEGELWKEFNSLYPNLPFHQFLGIRIIQEDEIIKEALGDYQPLVLGVLQTSEGDVSAFKTLSEIISSDFDADRLDNLIRDSHMSGADFGSYDLERLLESFQLYEHKNRFYIRPTIHAHSTLESVLFDRYKSYRWLYYHHRVMATNAVLRKIIDKLLFSQNKTDAPFSHFSLNFQRELHTDKEEFFNKGFLPNNHIAFFTDIYIMSTLVELYKHVSSEKNNNEGDNENRKEITQMRLLLQEILFRLKSGVSLWKDIKDFEDFDNKLVNIEEIYADKQRKNYFEEKGIELPERDIKKIKDFVARKEGTADYVLNGITLNYLLDIEDINSLETYINSELDQKEVDAFVLFITSLFTPLETNKIKEFTIIKDGRLCYISDISKVAEQFEIINRQTILLWAYLMLRKHDLSVLSLSQEDLSEQERKCINKIKEKVKNIIIQSLPKWFEMKINNA